MTVVNNIRLQVEEDFANRIQELQMFLSKRLGKKISKAALIIIICKMVFEEKEDLAELLLERILQKGFIPLGYFGKHYSCTSIHRTLNYQQEDIRKREINVQKGETELEIAKKRFNIGLREQQALENNAMKLNFEINDLKTMIGRLESDLKAEKKKNERLETRVEHLKMQKRE